jgi:Ala-tRNA(Pro) deacylase
VHVAGQQVAKAVLVKTESGYVLAVLPATYRVDLEMLARALNISNPSIANEDEVCRIFSDCEVGAVPPFGGIYGIQTVVESRLAANGEILVGGNWRHEGIRLRLRDYMSIERPISARFAVPIAPRRRLNSKRAG